MRTLKFRVYDHDKKQMLLPEKDIIILSNNGVTADTETWSVMQFTGLTDRHGKEIYEGDIVRDATGDLDVWVVVYVDDDASFYFQNPFDKSNLNSLNWLKTNGLAEESIFEIIGNIMENPELLK